MRSEVEAAFATYAAPVEPGLVEVQLRLLRAPSHDGCIVERRPDEPASERALLAWYLGGESANAALELQMRYGTVLPIGTVNVGDALALSWVDGAWPALLPDEGDDGNVLYAVEGATSRTGWPGDGATLNVPGSTDPGGWPPLASVPVASVEPVTGLASSAVPLEELAAGGTITWDAPARAPVGPLYLTLRVGTFERGYRGADTERRVRLVCAAPDDGTFEVPDALAALLEEGDLEVVGVDALRALVTRETRGDAIVLSTAVAEATLTATVPEGRPVPTVVEPLPGR